MMNKQQAIKTAEFRVIYPTEVRPNLEVLPLEEVKNIISQIHEPQKVVVPKFVAEWIEECKASRRSLRDSMKGVSTNPDVNAWLLSNGREMYTYPNQETFARAWLDGYEIEQEQLYTVEIPNPNGLVVCLERLDGEKIALSTLGKSELTEAEIKQDFDWAWQWAKEVE